MTGILCGFLLTGVASRAEEKGLQVGDAAPEFKRLDDQGLSWSSRDHIGQKMLVVYFYPSDFSFCCTRQALRYRDRLTELAHHDVEVVGISGDAVRAHRMFKDTHCLNFTLLSDGDGGVARQFGVPLRAGGKAMIKDDSSNAVVDEEGRAVSFSRKVTAARWTFIVGKDGKIIYRDTDVPPVKDSQKVLEFLCKLGAQ